MGTPKNKAVSVPLGKTFHDHGKLQDSLENEARDMILG